MSLKIITVHGYNFSAQTEDRMSQHPDAASRAMDYIAEAMRLLSPEEARTLYELAEVDPHTTPEQERLDRIADKATASAFDDLEYASEPQGACMSIRPER